MKKFCLKKISSLLMIKILINLIIRTLGLLSFLFDAYRTLIILKFYMKLKLKRKFVHQLFDYHFVDVIQW